MKNIPYLVILILIVIIMFKDCGGGKQSPSTKVKTVTKIDTVYKEISGSSNSEPTVITVTDTINHYIMQTETCQLPHLNDKGIDLIKHRTYSDTVQIKGYFVSYDMAVIGHLQGIELSLYGNVPTIRQSTVRTVTNERKRYRTIGAYINYNRSPQIGLQYANREFSYSLNYDLQYQSVGVQVGYNLFRF